MGACQRHFAGVRDCAGFKGEKTNAAGPLPPDLEIAGGAPLPPGL